MNNLVKTSYVYPPIPDRKFDWMASIDGEEHMYAYGPTEVEALKELCEMLWVALGDKQ